MFRSSPGLMTSQFERDLLPQAETRRNSTPFLTDWLLRPSQAARGILFSAGLADAAGHRQVLLASGRNAGLFALPLLAMAARASLWLCPDLFQRTRHSLDSNIAQQAGTWPAALRPLRINPAGYDQPETASAIMYSDTSASLSLSGNCRACCWRTGSRVFRGMPESAVCADARSNSSTTPGRVAPRSRQPENDSSTCRSSIAQSHRWKY